MNEKKKTYTYSYFKKKLSFIFIDCDVVDKFIISLQNIYLEIYYLSTTISISEIAIDDAEKKIVLHVFIQAKFCLLVEDGISFCFE